MKKHKSKHLKKDYNLKMPIRLLILSLSLSISTLASNLPVTGPTRLGRKSIFKKPASITYEIKDEPIKVESAVEEIIIEDAKVDTISSNVGILPEEIVEEIEILEEVNEENYIEESKEIYSTFEEDDSIEALVDDDITEENEETVLEGTSELHSFIANCYDLSLEEVETHYIDEEYSIPEFIVADEEPVDFPSEEVLGDENTLESIAPEFYCLPGVEKVRDPNYETDAEINARNYKIFMANIYENLLTEYSVYYHLDPVKVIDIAKKFTKDYEVSFVDINNTIAYNQDNVAAQIITFVSQLSRNKLKYNITSIGYSMASIKTSDTIEKLRPDLKMSNGSSFTEFLNNVASALDVDTYYAAAISYWETGWETSWLAKNKNNFGGLGGDGGYLSYCTPEAGIIEYLRTLKSYESYHFTDIYSFSGLYVYGDPNSCSDYWVNNVLWFKNEMISKKDTYFPVRHIEGESFMMLTREPLRG